MNQNGSLSTPQATESEVFYAGAHSRISRNMLVIALVSVLAGVALFGWKTGLGVLAGAVVASLNFYWLGRLVNSLADHATSPDRTETSSSGSKFLLRYALIAAIVYVIFKSSIVSLQGFLVGILLPVPAILFEAMYETYAALRRGL